MENNNPILVAAYRAWEGSNDFRIKRKRYKRFTYGDQWSDTVIDNNRPMSAAQAARDRKSVV